MKRQSRIPGMAEKKTLLILPEIRDDDPEAIKNAIAIRNSCAAEGVCPGCGVVGELDADPKLEGVFHLTFRHENWCGALTDEAA